MGARGFSTVMQTRDILSGLHNCLEFSQPLECLYKVMQTRKFKKKRFLLLNSHVLEKNLWHPGYFQKRQNNNRVLRIKHSRANKGKLTLSAK